MLLYCENSKRCQSLTLNTNSQGGKKGMNLVCSAGVLMGCLLCFSGWPGRGAGVPADLGGRRRGWGFGRWRFSTVLQRTAERPQPSVPVGAGPD